MIKVEHLVKKYGERYAVNDISFEVKKGEVVGFLGPNGAGKTTTMNMLTGYISSTSGHASIDGFDILENPMEAKSRIGYLPEFPPLYPEMTVKEYLDFIYDLKKCGLKRRPHINEICEVVKIDDVYKRPIKNLSKGYKQRVGIAGAIIGNPEVVIFDEPTNGLDPKQIIDIRNLIQELGREHTVILSTHILSEVKTVCDRIMIINEGKIVADEKTENIENALRGNRRILVRVDGPESSVLSSLRKLTGVLYAKTAVAHSDGSCSYFVESENKVDVRKPMFYMLAKNSWPILSLEFEGSSLEDVFVSVVNEADGISQQPEKAADGRKRQ